MKAEEYMAMAIELAKDGIGKVNPNPLVGAVVVKESNIIGMGFHEQYGGLHAERNALQNCNTSPNGSTLYVTLEPCCHYGKTPPCTEAIIESGIQKVVIGCLDANEKVAGKGVAILQKAGIEVVVGVLEKECKALNEIFFHYIQHKTPFVLMKYAMTMDGKITTITSDSKWITNEKSRENVHKTRNQYTGIMVGVGTILADNPNLTCRIKGGRNPIRIICDSHLRTPLTSQVIDTKEVKTIIATTNKDTNLHKQYIDRGVEIVETSSENGKVNLKELMEILGRKGMDSILLEGGASLNFSALESEMVHKIQCYIAPKIFGGTTAKTPVMGDGFQAVSNQIQLVNSKTIHFDEDFMIESEVQYVHRHH
ncbi:bifunctional diaminohydroxyphosphoribosylaminopyrimidine deaminase/5-amino-6-(5-phosphoribosylamino)uracil reductase RibD [Chakrabartyella piscis]|uniref:bifunctional diaminohydroxyphosphoribosylaminopyrimidine deaminase/5-amino-6-(5-phosphoribosylamino)uracil reductase RibD n=1 Tax=Chakrabartyella piscis TaxID=2918914 RepID=UPI0029584AC3|nr:bifunctional diaminohydroxyphosphoribosylaminopyrimidine deaminase/5-amino-6-(5-phosphoribosylamino)uracil reductase RibD [Chakrabartyella piscis]